VKGKKRNGLLWVVGARSSQLNPPGRVFLGRNIYSIKRGLSFVTLSFWKIFIDYCTFFEVLDNIRKKSFCMKEIVYTIFFSGRVSELEGKRVGNNESMESVESIGSIASGE